jgi:hypothetical protein
MRISNQVIPYFANPVPLMEFILGNRQRPKKIKIPATIARSPKMIWMSKGACEKSGRKAMTPHTTSQIANNSMPRLLGSFMDLHSEIARVDGAGNRLGSIPNG